MCAYKEGVEMARQLARKPEMHPHANERGDETIDGDDDDDEKWFYKLMK